ncbi:MAG: DUF599 domain-containing protein [Rhodospirillales bacterium]|nr:DUF599 domain-containing protein [Rhodospirillales bacterium]
MLPAEFTLLDYAALGWLVLCWTGYTIFADHSSWRSRSVTAVMSEYRHQWMRVMLRRENRIVDTNIIGNLLNGVAFFSSTSILAIGGLFAALAAPDSAIKVLEDLPLAVETTRVMWEVKVLVLVGILIMAFFKFAWAYRLFNNCSVLIGAAPIEAAEDPKAEELAARAARLNSLAARHFNRGLRAYFFALASLAWFINPLLFMAAVTWVVYVVFRRDFRSRSLEIVRGKG